MRENNNIAPTMLLCLSLALNYKEVTKNITDINITSLGINAVVSHTFENTHTKSSLQASSYAGCFENMSTILQLNFVPVNISVDFHFPEPVQIMSDFICLFL